MIDSLVLPSATLLIMGLCLWVSLRLLYGARGPTPDDDVHLLIRILSRALVLVGAIGVMISSTWWVSLVLLVIIAEAALEMVLARRAAQRHAAWQAVSSTLAGRPAAVPTLRLHQSRFTGIVGRRFRQLLKDLESGVPWSAAVAANRRALPTLAPTYLGVCATAPSPDDQDELQAVQDAPYRQLWHDTIQRFAYLATVLLTLCAVLAYSVIWVAPNYQSIFQDFDLELPQATAIILGGVESIVRVIGIPLAVAAAVLAAFLVFVAFAYLCDWAVLQPLLDWIGFSRHRAHVMRLLAAALTRDMPLSDALDRLRSGWSAYPSWLARRRLAAAGDSIAAGQAWTESLHDAQLISASDAATLRAAQETGHLPWTLRMLADRRLHLFVFRWAAIQHVIFTLAVLVLAALVFIFILAMFIPLVRLIESLAP